MPAMFSAATTWGCSFVIRFNKIPAQLLVGGFVWVVFLAFVNIGASAGIYHLWLEFIGIPSSWVLNYSLNARFAFHHKMQTGLFARFVVISGASWLLYIGVSWALIDLFGQPTIIGTASGAVVKTFFNVLLQQNLVFAKEHD